MLIDDIDKKFSDLVNKWRAADSQRMIFGVDMPQTQGAIENLLQSLQAVHMFFPSFSLVEKDGKMAIVVRDIGSDGNASSMSPMPIHLPSLPKVLKEIKVTSITLNTGVTKNELKEFFRGISMRVDELEQQGGLKGVMQGQGVTHIKVDQMKFQLLSDEEQIISKKGIADNILKGIKDDGKQQPAIIPKVLNTVWKDYLTGKIETGDFKDQHQDFIDAASVEPKKLEKILKRIATKQKKTEKYIAQLEQRLSDIGFSPDAVAALTKKLRTPKKVSVAEDELERLRKIEKEYQKGINKRADDALKTIKVIKKKLMDEMARSEAILHHLSQGAMILDKKGKILSVNATAQNVLGSSEEEIRWKNIKDVLKPHHLLTTVSDWQSETNTHTPKEVKVQAPNEETLAIIRESTIIVENESGRSIGIVSALHNVTQQEELNRRKNDILDVLGHDLRAPLGNIKQNFDVLVRSTKLNEECNEQQKKFLDNCKNNIARMGKLIEKIMDMRQLETGKIMLKYDVIEINKLLEEAVNALSEWAQSKNIKLEVQAQQMPNIDGDPERIFQVITNLVSNALKFTPEEGSIIAAGKFTQSHGTEFVEISIKDSGMGIDKENLDNIFDKYKQVTANTPAGVSGLGLGLSICKAIIELHGGSIRVDSELAKGSTFTVQIPVKRRGEDGND